MLNAINTLGTTYYGQQFSSQGNRETLGRDDFLKIFLAQLKYQDPLNPLEGTEFTAQLAQFSSLEQLFNVNEYLESLTTAQDESQKYQVLSLIGKEILAQGARLSLGEAGEARGGFRISEEASCTVQVLNQDGMEVRRIELGILQPGEHHFQWDGLDQSGNRLPSGAYEFRILATDTMGNLVNADTMISGMVDKVSLEGTSPVLYLGQVAVGLDQVIDIRMPASEATGENEGEDQGSEL